ncbi:tetratricopeptide repeat protein [Poriferisphaera sp. WC338]|uniref:tetratricopeptide repeat protein n=1 Tax=Poriferisphaera sp. WC338 TaxID=3425129 RepID=UPI003D81481E
MKKTIHTSSCLVLTLATAMFTTGCAGNKKTTNTAADLAPNSHAKLLYDEAVDYRQAGYLDAALATFGLALEENPSLTEAHLGMGHIYRAQGNLPVAENAYNRALEANPESYDANYYLGLTFQLQGNVAGAINQYLRAIVISPYRIEANRDIAAAYLQTGSPDSALQYAEAAVELAPESQAAWCNLAATCNLLGDYKRAVDAYREAAELGKLSGTIIPGFANAHIKQKNYNRAVNLLSPLAEKTTDPLILERLAFSQFKLRKFDEALEHYQQALAAKPNDTASLNGIGACYMTKFIQSGRKERDFKTKAYEAWRKSLNLNAKQAHIADLLVRYKGI